MEKKKGASVRINNFSGGLCSFWSAHRDVKEVGPLNVVLLFADTLIESAGTYRFIAAASDLLGVPVTRVSRELTPWQLFRQQRMIGNNRFPICSVYLKRELLDEWMMSNFEMDRRQDNFLLPKASLSIGFDWTEENRLRDLKAVHPTWDIRAPMQQEPICGGGCVRAGISHWVHLLKVRPATYADWERQEWETAEYLRSESIEPLSMLKDRRNGETKNLYLRDLRKRVEAGEKFERFDWGGCGCGGVA